MHARDIIYEQLQGGQLQTILATIPAGVFIVDADGRIMSANGRAGEIWGGDVPLCDRVESYGQYRGWWPETGEPLRAEDWAAARALRDGVPIPSEMVDIERFDGRRATILTSAAPLRDDDGRITGAVVAVLDVTEQRERQRTNQLLLDALNALAGSLELSGVLQRLVRVLLQMVGHTRASALLWHEATGELEIAAVMGGPEMPVGSRFPLSRYSLQMQQAIHNRRRTIADFTNVVEEELGLAGEHGIGSSLIVPLIRSGELLGAVSVDEMRPGVTFSERDIELVEGIASSAALTIENARLYEAERHVAMTLQRALLELPESMARVNFAHAYRSASEDAFVGGDFYDLFEIEHDLIGILIGDVAGKGLGAAVLTQLVKNAVRVHAAEKGSSPAAILSLTNNLFYQMTSPDMFATAFFGVLDRSTGRLVYTNAGHTTCFLVHSDRAPEELPATSPLLGAFVDRVFTQAEIRLDSADTLVLYTDGVTEARAGHRQYGEERLLRTIEGVGSSEPSEIVRAIVDDVLGFAGGSLSDDLAILVLQRLGDGIDDRLRQRLEVAVS